MGELWPGGVVPIGATMLRLQILALTFGAHDQSHVRKERPVTMASRASRFSYDDRYLPDDGKRYEFADGELTASPAPTYDHQRIV